MELEAPALKENLPYRSGRPPWKPGPGGGACPDSRSNLLMLRWVSAERGCVVKMGATPPPRLSQSNMPPSRELPLPRLRGRLAGGPLRPSAEPVWWCR